MASVKVAAKGSSSKSKSKGGGSLDKAAKIKAGASIAAIVVAMGFLAWHFGLFGGNSIAAGGPGGAAVQEPVTPEEQEEIDQQREEQLEWMEEEGIQPAGA